MGNGKHSRVGDGGDDEGCPCYTTGVFLCASSSNQESLRVARPS